MLEAIVATVDNSKKQFDIFRTKHDSSPEDTAIMLRELWQGQVRMLVSEGQARYIYDPSSKRIKEISVRDRRTNITQHTVQT